MERTPDVILMEIKEALRGISLKVEELENIMDAQDTEFAGDAEDFVPMDPVDLDIDLGEDSGPEPESVAGMEDVAVPEPEPEPKAEAEAESEAIAGLEPVEDMEPEPEPEPVPEQEPEPVAEKEPATEPEPVPEPEDLPAPEDFPAPEAKPAVIDVMTKSRAWKIDMPGSPVSNILSAISLNDRILFINTLFDKDPVLFQNTIRLLNSYSSLSQAEEYIATNFQKWNLDSDTVYRFMMAVRRKLN